MQYGNPMFKQAIPFMGLKLVLFELGLGRLTTWRPKHEKSSNNDCGKTQIERCLIMWRFPMRWYEGPLY